MDNTYYLEHGLHLPFRFYDDRNKISEATDYGRKLSIPKSEFLIMPYGTILPFQVVRAFSAIPIADFTLIFYCINTLDDYDFSAAINKYFRIRSIGSVDYITFLGINPDLETIDLPIGNYYAVWSDGVTTRYSENIQVTSEVEFIGTYRAWSDSNTDLRTIDGTNLRII